MRDEVIRSLKWVAIGKALGQAIRWGTTIFTLRLLFPEDYTVIALGSFFSALLWSLSTGGLASAVIREPDLTPEKQSQFYTFMIMAHVLFFLLMQGSAPFISQFYDNPAIEAVLQVTAFNFLIVLIGFMQQTKMNREMNFKKLSMVDAFSESVGSLVTVAMAYADYGYWSIVVGNLASSVLKQCSYVVVEKSRVIPAKITSSIADMVVYAKNASFHGFVAHLATHIDIAIAGIVMSQREVGIYQFAIVVAMIPASKVMPIVRQVAFPAYAKIQNDSEKQLRYFLKSQRMAYLLFIPIFWGIAGCASLAVPLVFGDKWVEASTAMLIYCLSMPFRSGEQMFSPLLKSTGKLNVLITNIFITFAILTPCFYFIGKSPELMALAWLIGFTISYTITTARSCKAIGLSIVEKWRNITLPFVAGGIMLVLVYATGDYLQSSGIFEPVSLLIQILIGAVSYISVLICIKRELVFELLSLVRGKLK